MASPVAAKSYIERIEALLEGGGDREPEDTAWTGLAEEIVKDGDLGMRERSLLLVDFAERISAAAKDGKTVTAISLILDHAQILMSSETEPYCLLRLAGLLRDNGDFASALEIYRRTLSYPPADLALGVLAHNGAGVALWQGNHQKEALDEFEVAFRDAETSSLEADQKSEIAWNLVTAASRCGVPRRAGSAVSYLMSPRACVPVSLVRQLVLDVLRILPDLLDAGEPARAVTLAVQCWRFCCRRLNGNEMVLDGLDGAALLAFIGRARELSDDPHKARGALEVALRRFLVEAPDQLDFIETICVALMSSYRSMGFRTESVRTADRLVALKTAALGETHPETLRAKATLAREFYGNDQRKEAADLQRILTQVSEHILRDVELAALHVDLAKTLIDDGQLLEAGRCLGIAEQKFPPGAAPGGLYAFHYARALLLRKRQLPEQALPEVDHALRATAEAFGERSNRLGPPLQLRGGILLDLERYDDARESYEKVLKLEHLLPSEEVKALHNLGYVAQRTNDLLRAWRLHEDVLVRKEALGQARSSIAATLVNLGAVVRDLGDRPKALEYLERALAIEIDVFGPHSVDARYTRNNLAGVLAGEGRFDEALSQMELVLDTQTKRLTDLLVLGTDHERLAAIRETFLELFAYLGTAAYRLGSDSALAERAYRQVIARKGLASEAFVRARHEPITADSLTIVVDSLDRLRSHLPEATILVDFIEYGHVRIDTGPDSRLPVVQEPCLGAFVIANGQRVRFVDLGRSKLLRSEIDRFLAAATGRHRKTFREISAFSQALARLVWYPLELTLDGIDHLLISPDGPLDRVSFAALEIQPEQWLGDSCALSYISSGRELLSSPASAAYPLQEPIVFAAPYFGPKNGAVWNHLKGAAREGILVAEVCKVEVVAGEAATAEALLAVTSPRYLHIATHGVYCDPRMLPKEGGNPVLSQLAERPDPMERSALVMAVTDCESALSRGDPKAAGIVTAGELCRLDLRGTELVVLSACDSGRGDPVPLDGTHGLRRAFRAAGASCVIGTFWPVDDQATPGLMKSLYRLLQAGLPPNRALQEAMRTLKKVHREPHFWAAFFVYGISRSSDAGVN